MDFVVVNRCVVWNKSLDVSSKMQEKVNNSDWRAYAMDEIVENLFMTLLEQNIIQIKWTLLLATGGDVWYAV